MGSDPLMGWTLDFPFGSKGELTTCSSGQEPARAWVARREHSCGHVSCGSVGAGRRLPGCMPAASPVTTRLIVNPARQPPLNHECLQPPPANGTSMTDSRAVYERLRCAAGFGCWPGAVAGYSGVPGAAAGKMSQACVAVT